MSNLSVVPGVVVVNISWNPPSEPNGMIVNYEVSSFFNGELKNINTSDTQYTLRDLPPGSFIVIAVRAYTVIGPGNFTVAFSNTMDIRKCITVLYINFIIVECGDYVDWGTPLEAQPHSWPMLFWRGFVSL